MPNDFLLHAQPYGIVQTPFAQQALVNLEASSLKPVTMLLLELQMNPRPDGHESDEQFGAGLTSVVVKDTSPPHYVIYRIDEDEKRVVVIAIAPKNW